MNEEWYEYLRFTTSQIYFIAIFLLLNISIKCIPYFSFYPKLLSEVILQDNQIKNSTTLERHNISKYKSHAILSSDKNISEKSNPHSLNSSKNKKGYTIHDLTIHKEDLFMFDPNTISYDSIQLLDISSKAKDNWTKYRDSGGKFYDKSSISKIYDLSYNDIENLSKRVKIKPHYHKKSNGLKLKVNINSASIEDWKSLKGIGPYYAKNIIKYRNELGGFNSINQISEVFRLPDSSFQSIRPQLVLDDFTPRKNINTISQKELFQHPYISYKQAKAIIKYRVQHGPFQTIEELNDIISISSEFIDRIKPYFIKTKSDTTDKKLSSVH